MSDPRPFSGAFFTWRSAVQVLVVALVLALGHHTPVAGFLLGALAPDEQVQLASMNIFAAGLSAWFPAWVLVQLAVSFRARFKPTGDGLFPVADALGLPVKVLALLFSGLIWFGLLDAITSIFMPVPLNAAQRVVGMASGVAGTALLFFLASRLDRLAKGYGFWALVALFELHGFAVSVPPEIGFLWTGAVSRNTMLLSAGFMLVTLVAAVALMRQRASVNSPLALHFLAVLLMAGVVTQAAAPLVLSMLELQLLDSSLPKLVQDHGFDAVYAACALVLLPPSLWVVTGLKPGWRALAIALSAMVTMIVATTLNRMVDGMNWSYLTLTTMAFLALLAQQASERVGTTLFKPRANAAEDDTMFDDEFRRGWRR